MNAAIPPKPGLKEKVMDEVKELLVIFFYLAFFFCTFTTYRQLVMHEMGVGYYHYGFALLKALILAKVIMLGQLVPQGRVFDDRPLIVPTLYKVVLFTAFTVVFDVFEHAVGGVLHGKAMMSGIQEIISVGKAELLSRTLVVMAAFIPFFAFGETARVLGDGRLHQLFFRKR